MSQYENEDRYKEIGLIKNEENTLITSKIKLEPCEKLYFNHRVDSI